MIHRENNRTNGVAAEVYVMKKLAEHGVQSVYKDLWYDILVGDVKARVEIKSARLIQWRHSKNKDPIKRSYFRYGRFDFNGKDRRMRLIKDNTWICFVTRYRDDFCILGFVKARHLKTLAKHRNVEMSGLLRDHSKKILSIKRFCGNIRERDISLKERMDRKQ